MVVDQITQVGHRRREIGCVQHQRPTSSSLSLFIFADTLVGRHLPRQPIVDAVFQQGFQLLSGPIGISITGKQAFEGVLLDGLALHGGQRFRALLLLVCHVNGQAAH